MKILAITQSRMSSTRLPGKVLMKIEDNTLLHIHINRVAKSQLITQHLIATSTSADDDILEQYCEDNSIKCYRGSELDVLDRFYLAAKEERANVVVRLTGDCPLIDAEVIDDVITTFLEKKTDYASNILKPTYPDGLDVEVFSFKALEKAWREATLPSDREHVTPYIWRNSSAKGGEIFTSVNCSYKEDFSVFRVTVDEKEDFELIKTLVRQIGSDKHWREYINLIIKLKLDMNSKFGRNDGYFKSLKNDNQL